MFLHGVDMDPSAWQTEASAWNVEEASNEFGFIGVIPVGSIGSSGLAYWNIDKLSGVDEATFLHNVLAAVTSAHSVDAALPRVALGFSNGAGMSSIMGCHDSSSLYVAHVGVRVNPSADYPQTCNANNWSTVPVWSGVGSADFFLSSLTPTPSEGVKAQFQALCPSCTWTTTFANNTECLEFMGSAVNGSPSACTNAGQFCLYEDMGHTLTPSLASNAWAYLTATSGYTERGWTGNTPSKDDAKDGGKDGDWDWGDKDVSGDKGNNVLDSGGVVEAATAAKKGSLIILLAFLSLQFIF